MTNKYGINETLPIPTLGSDGADQNSFLFNICDPLEKYIEELQKTPRPITPRRMSIDFQKAKEMLFKSFRAGDDKYKSLVFFLLQKPNKFYSSPDKKNTTPENDPSIAPEKEKLISSIYDITLSGVYAQLASILEEKRDLEKDFESKTEEENLAFYQEEFFKYTDSLRKNLRDLFEENVEKKMDAFNYSATEKESLWSKFKETAEAALPLSYKETSDIIRQSFCLDYKKAKKNAPLKTTLEALRKQLKEELIKQSEMSAIAIEYRTRLWTELNGKCDPKISYHRNLAKEIMENKRAGLPAVFWEGITTENDLLKFSDIVPITTTDEMENNIFFLAVSFGNKNTHQKLLKIFDPDNDLKNKTGSLTKVYDKTISEIELNSEITFLQKLTKEIFSYEQMFYIKELDQTRRKKSIKTSDKIFYFFIESLKTGISKLRLDEVKKCYAIIEGILLRNNNKIFSHFLYKKIKEISENSNSGPLGRSKLHKILHNALRAIEKREDLSSFTFTTKLLENVLLNEIQEKEKAVEESKAEKQNREKAKIDHEIELEDRLKSEKKNHEIEKENSLKEQKEILETQFNKEKYIRESQFKKQIEEIKNQAQKNEESLKLELSQERAILLSEFDKKIETIQKNNEKEKSILIAEFDKKIEDSKNKSKKEKAEFKAYAKQQDEKMNMVFSYLNLTENFRTNRSATDSPETTEISNNSTQTFFRN